MISSNIVPFPRYSNSYVWALVPDLNVNVFGINRTSLKDSLMQFLCFFLSQKNGFRTHVTREPPSQGALPWSAGLSRQLDPAQSAQRKIDGDDPLTLTIGLFFDGLTFAWAEVGDRTHFLCFFAKILMFMFILSPMFVSPQLTTEAATIRNRYWSMEIFGVHSETFPKRHPVTPWNAKTYLVWRVIRFDDTCEGSNFNPAKAFD